MQISIDREELANSIDMLAAISGKGEFSGLDEIHLKVADSILYLSLYGTASCVRSRLECEMISDGECAAKIKPIRAAITDKESDVIQLFLKKEKLHVSGVGVNGYVHTLRELSPHRIGSIDWFQPEKSLILPNIAPFRALLNRASGFWDEAENPYGIAFNCMYFWFYPSKIAATSYSNNRMAIAEFAHSTGFESKLEIPLHYKNIQPLHAMLKRDEGEFSISWNQNTILVKTDQHDFYCNLVAIRSPELIEQLFVLDDSYLVTFDGKEARDKLSSISGILEKSDSGVLVKIRPTELRMKCSGEGEFHAKLPANSNIPQEMLIGFTHDHLKKLLQGHAIEVSFKDSNERTVWTYPGDEMNTRYMVCPLRI